MAGVIHLLMTPSKGTALHSRFAAALKKATSKEVELLFHGTPGACSVAPQCCIDRSFASSSPVIPVARREKHRLHP
jgi:hypothetical protein